eukprot:968794_1
MACACPCFGDEADAEEKPNQMIQLDGLGMLRLDTQHVGQGSQGARSAKWFYFGETDNRLAVVNMLLCITCVMLWICLAVAINMASRSGATTTDIKGNKQSNGNLAEQSAVLNLNRLVTKLYPDVVNKYTDAHTAFVRLIQLDGEKNAEGIQTTDTAEKFKRLQEKYTKDLLNAKNTNKKLDDRLKIALDTVATHTTELEALKTGIDKIQSDFGSEKVELKDLPAYVQRIFESKEETEDQLHEIQAKYTEAQPLYDQLEAQFKQQAFNGGYDGISIKEYAALGKKIQQRGKVFQDWLKRNNYKKKETAATNDELDVTTNDSDENRKSNDANTGAGSDAGGPLISDN